MPMVRAMRLINAIEAGTLTSIQLEALLTADAGRLGDLRSLFTLQGQCSRIYGNPTMMGVLAGSAKALLAMCTVEQCLAYVVIPGLLSNSTTSSVTASAIGNSVAAKMQLFNSDKLLTLLANSKGAVTALRGAPGYSVYGSSSSAGDSLRSLSGMSTSGSYIVLGCSTNDGTVKAVMTVGSLRSGSTLQATNTTSVDNTYLATALGPLVMPMVSPFNIVSNDPTNQIGYVGALRCDV